MNIDLPQLQEVIEAIREISPEIWQMALQNAIYWGYVDWWLGVGTLVLAGILFILHFTITQPGDSGGVLICSVIVLCAGIVLLAYGGWRLTATEFSAMRDLIDLMPQ